MTMRILGNVAVTIYCRSLSHQFTEDTRVSPSCSALYLITLALMLSHIMLQYCYYCHLLLQPLFISLVLVFRSCMFRVM